MFNITFMLLRMLYKWFVSVTADTKLNIIF